MPSERLREFIEQHWPRNWRAAAMLALVFIALPMLLQGISIFVAGSAEEQTTWLIVKTCLAFVVSVVSTGYFFYFQAQAAQDKAGVQFEFETLGRINNNPGRPSVAYRSDDPVFDKHDKTPGSR